MYSILDSRMEDLSPARLDAIEISGVQHQHHPWRSFTSVQYPEFDLCASPENLDQYDVVVCDQVLEHVVDPANAVMTLFRLTRPGGLCLVATPFLYKVHAAPDDYWRFTPRGLEVLLAGAGFDQVETGSWGNKACIKANLPHPVPWRPWRSLRSDDPNVPIVVWAFARRH